MIAERLPYLYRRDSLSCRVLYQHSHIHSSSTRLYHQPTTTMALPICLLPILHRDIIKKNRLPVKAAYLNYMNARLLNHSTLNVVLYTVLDDNEFAVLDHLNRSNGSLNILKCRRDEFTRDGDVDCYTSHWVLNDTLSSD